MVQSQARESEMGVYTFKHQSQKAKNKDKINEDPKGQFE